MQRKRERAVQGHQGRLLVPERSTVHFGLKIELNDNDNVILITIM